MALGKAAGLALECDVRKQRRAPLRARLISHQLKGRDSLQPRGPGCCRLAEATPVAHFQRLNMGSREHAARAGVSHLRCSSDPARLLASAADLSPAIDRGTLEPQIGRQSRPGLLANSVGTGVVSRGPHQRRGRWR